MSCCIVGMGCYDMTSSFYRCGGMYSLQLSKLNLVQKSKGRRISIPSLFLPHKFLYYTTNKYSAKFFVLTRRRTHTLLHRWQKSWVPISTPVAASQITARIGEYLYLDIKYSVSSARWQVLKAMLGSLSRNM